MTRNPEAEAFFAPLSAHGDVAAESPTDRTVALATGAVETKLGPDWVEITLFRADWPTPDLRHWALRAYRYARTGR